MMFEIFEEEVKLILEPNQLIQKLKSKGVKFELCTEEEAVELLDYHNYYVKLTAYKTNFHKHDNKYVGLDFKALKDLSTIDMHLKKSILNASLSIEHFLKVNLLKDVQERQLDEFQLTADYLSQYSRAKDEIQERRNNCYVKDLLLKFDHPIYPIWVFLEVISFGEFVNFYRYYCQKYSCGPLDYKILYSVKNIRNAAAHNNCVIHKLTDKSGYYKREVVDKLHEMVPDIKRGTIQNRLKNVFVQDFVSLLIALDVLIKSRDVKGSLIDEFTILFENRMPREASLYKSSQAIKQTYYFCKEVLDTVKNRTYNNNTN